MAHIIRILLADDSEKIRRAIRLVLAVEPAIRIVAEAETYSDLLKLLPESRVDVVLMDIHMPGVRGADSLMKEALGSTCLIAISFWTDQGTSKVAESFGAFRLLDKAELVQTLIPAIEECTRSRPKAVTTDH